MITEQDIARLRGELATLEAQKATQDALNSGRYRYVPICVEGGKLMVRDEEGKAVGLYSWMQMSSFVGFKYEDGITRTSPRYSDATAIEVVLEV